jgi:transketolase
MLSLSKIIIIYDENHVKIPIEKMVMVCYNEVRS